MRGGGGLAWSLIRIPIFNAHSEEEEPDHQLVRGGTVYGGRIKTRRSHHGSKVRR